MPFLRQPRNNTIGGEHKTNHASTIKPLFCKDNSTRKRQFRFGNIKTQLSLFKRIIFTKLNEKRLTISLGSLLKEYLQDCLLIICFLISNSRIDGWVKYYNEKRFHESLDNLTPRDIYLGQGEKIKKIRETIKQNSTNKRIFDNKRMKYQTK